MNERESFTAYEYDLPPTDKDGAPNNCRKPGAAYTWVFIPPMRNTLFRPDLSYGNAFEFVYQLPILGSLAMGNVAQVFASISKGRKMIEPKTGEKWNIFQKEINSGQIVTATHVGRSRFIAGLRFPASKNDITFYLLLSALSQNSASEHKIC